MIQLSVNIWFDFVNKNIALNAFGHVIQYLELLYTLFIVIMWFNSFKQLCFSCSEV